MNYSSCRHCGRMLWPAEDQVIENSVWENIVEIPDSEELFDAMNEPGERIQLCEVCRDCVSEISHLNPVKVFSQCRPTAPNGYSWYSSGER